MVNDDEDDANHNNSLRRNSTIRKQQDLFVDNDVHLSKSVVSQGDTLIQKADSGKIKQEVQKTGCASCLDKMTPFILMIGLGIHSIFEGLSLGLNQKYKDTAVMAVAIFLHKGAAGMSLGISMQNTFGKDSKSDTFVICMMVLFALFTPLGVFLGWVIA